MKTDYKKIFFESLEKESIAGFQNMGDLPRAVKYILSEGYHPVVDVPLQSLIYKDNDVIFLMFIIPTIDVGDIVVFMKGEVRPGKFGGQFLHTKPVKILKFQELREDYKQYMKGK